MMELPTSSSKHSGEVRRKKHVDKVRMMIREKGGGIAASSVKSLTLAKSSLGRKVRSVLQRSANNNKKQTRRSGTGSVADIKKKYGFGLKSTLRLAGVFGVLILISLVIVSGIGFAFAIDAYQKAPVINPAALQAKESSIIYLNDGKTELFRLHGTQNRKNVRLADVPLSMQYSIVGLEEKDYYKQDLPWLSLLRAVQECVTSRVLGSSSQCAGGSGLAQQLYRNVTGDNLSTIQRKIRELFAAKKLSDTNDKEQILELYLNWVPFGKEVAGVQVAAETYFGKDIKDVSLPQACLIASMPQNPANFENGIYVRTNQESPNYVFWKRLEDRKNICLENLLTYDIKGDGKRLIGSREELDKLKQEDLAIIPKRDNRKYPHFQDFAEKELNKIFPDQTQLLEGGYKIVTSLDPNLQDKLDQVYDSDENKAALADAPVNNAAAVVLEGSTGRIVAMRGSMDYNNKEIGGENNIVDSGQAPGSSMKPYDYLANLSEGFNPATVYLDAKTDFGGGYKPNNYNGVDLGPITMAYALQNSVNITAVKSAYLAAGAGQGPDGVTGMTNINDFAGRAGLKYPRLSETCKNDVSNSLGSCDVNMLSHATAYNTLAQDGYLRTASPFVSITREPRATRDEADKALADAEAEAENKEISERLAQTYPQKEAAIDPLIARQLQNIMSDQDLRTEGFGSSARYLIIDGWKNKIAAKTGTATGEGNRASDLWTVGYTKKYTVATWAGNTDNTLVSGYGNTFSVFVTSPTWQKVMQYLHADIDPNAPENSFSTEGLVKVNGQCPPGTRGAGRCANEWFTPDQSAILRSAQDRISKADYNPFENTIFANRNEVFVAKKFINKIDRKVVDKDKFPAEYVEEVTCVIATSAFPQSPNWRTPANSYTEKQENKCNERSSVDPNAIGVDTTLSPNLSNGQSLNAPLTITAKGRVDGQSISRIDFKVDGNILDSAEGGSLTVNPSTLGVSGKRFVVISVIDKFGKSYDFNYSDILFPDLQPLAVSDISSSVICLPLNSPSQRVVVGTEFSCSFSLPSNRSWLDGNNVRMSIGNTASSPCSYQISDRKFLCNSVDSTGAVVSGAGTVIKVGLRGDSMLDTASRVYLKNP